LGANLARALRDRLGPDTGFIGVGGPKLAALGLRSVFDPSALALLGVFNAVAAYPEVLRRAGQVAALARAERPDAAILIDAWGFNLRIARALRKADPDLPLIKYVAPQVWATRPGRARTLARAVDKLLTIHSFDSKYFESEGLSTSFVGNPALNRDFGAARPERLRAAMGVAEGEPILLLLPGSRASEVDRLMPVFDGAARVLKVSHPHLRLVMAVADGMSDRLSAQLAHWRHKPFLVRDEASRLDAMRAATVALACSGTVTTELALAGCPMIVAYRLGPVTHLIAKLLIRTPYITLFNVAAQKFIAPERVQDRCSARRLAKDVARRLDDETVRLRQIAEQAAALSIMRGGVDDPIKAAADAVLSCLRERSRE
jgi:lipid-A-disaccharide synthase